MSSLHDFDAYGVPTFYMNVPIAESAGGGNVRIWNCKRCNGILIPVCEIIIPAADLLTASRIVTQAAMETIKLGLEMLAH